MPRSCATACSVRAVPESMPLSATAKRLSPPRGPASRSASVSAFAPCAPMLLLLRLSSSSEALRRSAAASTSAPAGPRPSKRCPERSRRCSTALASSARPSFLAPAARMLLRASDSSRRVELRARPRDSSSAPALPSLLPSRRSRFRCGHVTSTTITTTMWCDSSASFDMSVSTKLGV
eukprot:355645-Chlamydomonas_euryale.AAC.4